MNSKITAKRLLIGIVLIFFLMISSGVIFSIIYKDEIIGYFIKETNKHITTPVDVGEIDVSIFNHFPNVSINLKNVTIKESLGKNEGTLGKAKRINISFNPIDIINKNYTINGLYIFDAEVNLRIDKDGNPNYLFFNKDSTSSGTTFSLNSITGKNIQVNFLDQSNDYHIAFYIKNASSGLKQIDQNLMISASGELVSDEIKVEKRIFFNNKVIEINTDLEVDLKNRVYNIKSGNFKIDKGEFDVLGQILVNEKLIDLNIKGVNTSFQTINSLLSKDLSKYFKDYKSKGSIYFSGRVNGEYGGKSSPQVSLEFGAKNASFFHPEYKKQIKNVNVTGSFNSGTTNKPANYRLDLKNFSCKLEDKLLEGNLTLQNFHDYRIDLILKGEADVNTLLLLFPKKYVKSAFGNLQMDIHINGRLKNPKLTETLDANGEVKLKNVSFVLTGEKLPFNKINGSLMLRKNDLAISDLSGSVGNSDFKLNGYFNDISNLLLAKNQTYKMQADLQSGHLDFDELLKSNFASRDTTSRKNNKYEFRISPKIFLDFNCDINHLKFKRFQGRNIKGQIEIKDQIAVYKNIAFSSMGGSVNVSGSVNSKRENIVETITEASLYNINIDSVFYVFKNFNQDWLIDRNLKGQLNADLNLYMNFNKNLKLNTQSLVADINTTITNGELNNFEPMMELSKFVEEESLANMRFSRITNEIKIEDKTIFLPEMEIKSNVSNILISGTHTFDKEIDYHLRVPLKSFFKVSKKSGFSESARSGMSLLLKITGNTFDYTISYDTKALKESIKKDFLDEGKEWRNIRNKKTDTETPELEEEYFEFDDSENDSTDTTNQ